MEKKFNDSSSALSRFGRDKRVRTVTAATERVERRPRAEKSEGGRFGRQERGEQTERNFNRAERGERSFNRTERGERSFNRNDRGAKGGKPTKRASYNPHFSEDNRPLFEEQGERKSFGAKRTFGDKKFAGKAQGDKKFEKKPFDKKRSFKRDEERPRSYPKFNPERQTGEMRLNRFLAQSGICSRREADDLITAGLVTVNGVIVSELGTKVLPTDEVKFNDSRVQGEKKVYLVLNKPKGYVTSLDDPHAGKLVMDLVKGACEERIYPVGRLDKNSLGLLLFTNDGDLTKTLTHPSYRKKKIYQVSLDKPLTRADMDRLAEGITLEDGEIYADEISYLKDNKQEVGIEIHSGRNRIVRRMFEFLGYTVTKLDRVYYAGLTKKNLKRGAWRFLSKEEVTRLKAGLYE
ncbi:MAG: rRNA pseudouridine synthase [Alistipes sp.]|nr:rRNA pseudouridine synthase [Alistipes sp.]